MISQAMRTRWRSVIGGVIALLITYRIVRWVWLAPFTSLFGIVIPAVIAHGIDVVSVELDQSQSKTISIPLRGVMLQLRGKYQSPRSPWPAQKLFGATIPALNPDVDGFGREGRRTLSDALSRNEFVATFSE